MNSHRISAALGLGLWILAAPPPALAGPPYVTDDPEPTDTGHLEMYAFASGTSAAGATLGQTGVEIDDGAAKDVQITLVIPLDYDTTGSARTGSGPVEIGGKYRFLHQAAGSWPPDVAFFPSVELPTASRPFGDGHATLLLPLWAQKDFGDWSVFGGGGYTINPGAGHQNLWQTGLAVTRKVSDRLELGAEIYHFTPDTPQGSATTSLGTGFIYQLSQHFALVGSGGPSIQNARGAGQSSFYAALRATY